MRALSITLPADCQPCPTDIAKRAKSAEPIPVHICPWDTAQIVKKLKDHGSRAGPMNGRRRKDNKDRKDKDWDAKWTRPKDTTGSVKEKGGEKANGFGSEPKPSSPYSTASRQPRRSVPET